MKKIYIVIGIVAILIIVLVWNNKKPVDVSIQMASSYKDATYKIGGVDVTLKNGYRKLKARLVPLQKLLLNTSATK